MLAASENGPRGTRVNVSMRPSHHAPLTFPLARVMIAKPSPAGGGKGFAIMEMPLGSRAH